jgi:RNA polymerase sigma-70 factor (ECF subfamily)
MAPPRDDSSLDRAMERYASGDDAAFGALYEGLAPRLYGFLYRQTRDEALADDLLQQTMLRIHGARGRFVPGAAVIPWAFAIARRGLIDAHRRGRRVVLARDEDDAAAELLASLDASAEELVDAQALADALRAALLDLPENQRVAFELVKQEGLGLGEAAAVLGTTVAAVKLRAHRAYEALRAAIARRPS